MSVTLFELGNRAAVPACEPWWKLRAWRREFPFFQFATYTWKNLDLGVQWKFVSSRFVTLVDDLSVPSYATIDADIRIHWTTSPRRARIFSSM